jgi:hypothetical protein
MPESIPTYLSAAVFIVLFPLLWLLIIWLISRLGGWNSLAKTFATERPPTGDMFTWSSGKFSFFSSYNNCLNVTVSSTGVHVAPMLLFSFGHQPLFFPWDKISRLVQRRVVFNYVSGLHIDTAEGMHPVSLYGRRLAEGLHRYAPASLKGESEPVA